MHGTGIRTETAQMGLGQREGIRSNTYIGLQHENSVNPKQAVFYSTPVRCNKNQRQSSAALGPNVAVLLS